jgi:large subunit ribosomal protein L10
LKKSDKENFVADMKSRLQKAKATFLIGYQGLNVEALSSLRNALRKNDVELRVVKNRLLRLASQGTDTEVINQYFVGSCALAITYGDPIAPAKALIEQNRSAKFLEIKVGQISGKVIDLESIKRLAELPSREVLLAQVLSGMQAVPATFVRVLNAVLLNFLFALKAIEKQKQECSK